MKVEQISVFLENKAGRLAEVTNTLATNGINIRALSLADTTDFGILRLIVDNSENAKSVLKDKGFTVGKTNVVAVEVEDKPGGLNHILDTLGNNGINVEYMYAFVMPGSTNATLIFRFDKTDQAVEILSENNIPIIPGTKLHAQ
ncbi:ACT domain-containing protein [Halodesulfovibrio sp.]|uniref:ACT domain-containing protein n=1 Tax=Halodesulfovibrio sp. TaxID=1912772 RepID=UPI0025BC66FD|nr:ACT domain-containing protein [Halodesulfovibrio sp.]